MRLCRNIVLSILAVLLLLYAAIGLFLASGKTLGERHAPFPHAAFDYANGSFADYIAYAREQITAGAVVVPDDAVIANLLPFELVPPAQCPRDAEGRVEQGIVLIHGLFETPYSMRALGEDLNARCLHVLALLLPDHGTRPGDFLDAHWEDWSAATRFATAQLAQRANTVILGGHSAGGALSLLEALRYPRADALILFAPALAITPAARLAKFLVPLGRLLPGAAWVGLGNDDAVYRYESITFTAAAEMQALTEALAQAWRGQQRQLPIFTVATVEDSTVGTPQILDFMAQNAEPRSRTLLYSQHAHPGGRNVDVVASHAPDQGVLSLSHLGLMIPPDDPHYGRDGAYRNCGHYESGNEVAMLASCQAGQRDYYGEPNAENSTQGVVERIAFNPWYPQLLQRIETFLDSL